MKLQLLYYLLIDLIHNVNVIDFNHNINFIKFLIIILNFK